MTAKARHVYDTDFFEWSQGQAQLLKSLRLGGTALPADLDIDQIAEEIEDLGKAELHAVESQLQNILVHILKAAAVPMAHAVPHWRYEATTFYVELVRKYSRSMRQRIEMEKIWRLAQRLAQAALREHGEELVQGLPVLCPFTIDDLVSDDFDFDRAREWLGTQLTASPSA